MGIYLLDVNVLIALAWPEHEAHGRVGRWFSRRSRSGWATCPFTQAAFVRILSNPAFSPGALSPRNALAVLQANVKLPGHHFWPVELSLHEAVVKAGIQITGHRQITDAYLVGIAAKHGGKLATLDSKLVRLASDELVEEVP